MRELVSEGAIQNGYGTITYINAIQLFVSFTLVAIFAVISDEGLNSLEKWAHEVGFQELFQRIYRELMVMGVASFAINVLSASNSGDFGSWEYAYYFSDNLIFLISAFFCFQGIGVMAVSLFEARSWDRASKISTEELLLDVEKEIRENSISWRNRWLPFCRTRDQVEFRMLNALFTKLYKIGGSKETFNFGYYLRLSHQKNVIVAIDMTPVKWFAVVVFVGFISLYYEFNIFDSHDDACIHEHSILSFIIFGLVVLILAGVLCVIARKYELRLLALTGVTSISDYDIYLHSEGKISEALQARVVDRDLVLSAIAQVTVEREISRSADLYKKKQEKKSLKQSFKMLLSPIFGSNANVCPADEASESRELRYAASESSKPPAASSALSAASSAAPSRIASYESAELGMADEDFNLRVREFRNSVKVTSMDSGDSLVKLVHPDESVDGDEPTAPVTETVRKNSTATTFPVPALSSATTSRNVRRKTIFDVAVEKKLIEDVIVTMQGHRGGAKAQAVVSTKVSSSKVHLEAELAKHKAFFQLETDKGLDYLKHFREIFFWHEPELFFILVHTVMLANSIYISWWITTIVFFALTLETVQRVVVFLIMSLIPPLLVFPLLAMLIRYTTVFKVLMRLDPELVTSTMRKAEMTNTAIKALQQNLRIRMLGMAGDCDSLSRSQVLDVFEDINKSGSMFISLSEFQLMLSKINIHLSKVIVMDLFAFIDINNDSLLSVEEFERFVFPDQSAEDDKKKAKFFDVKNQKEIASKGKTAASNRMIDLARATSEE